MSARDLLLYGTEQLPTRLRGFTIGPLGFSLDGGNVRYVTWRGIEVLRAISFIVRDSRWGTHAPLLSGFEVEQADNRVAVSYTATVAGAEGDFSFDASIVATADGMLTFDGRGTSQHGFGTNRTGFVILHGISGVAGLPVDVEHVGGGRESAAFPLLVDPDQPIVDIRSLTHSPSGITVAVTMEGEAYEMEDQRNWTDASYKTYVRPLSKGYPYQIAAGATVEQKITLRVTETAPASTRTGTRHDDLTVGGPKGTMPEIGLALTSWSDEAPLSPSYFVGRIDLTAGPSPLPEERPNTVVDLDVVIPGRDPDAELAPLANLQWAPRRVLVVPQRDMRSRPANQLPAGEARYEDIIAAARRCFPRSAVGGGMLVGFPELNRNRPPRGIDFVVHSTSAIVHAADDHSVLETHEALGSLIATVRAFAGAIPYRLGPATIGAPSEFYAASPAANPDNIRKTTADADPRQRGLFAAAFAIGYAAAVAGQVEALTIGCTGGGAAVAGPDGPYPVATAVQWLAAIAGRPHLETTSLPGLAIVAAADVRGRVLLVANLTAEAKTFAVAGFRQAAVLDAEALLHGGVPRVIVISGGVTLDAYAILRAVDG